MPGEPAMGTEDALEEVPTCVDSPRMEAAIEEPQDETAGISSGAGDDTDHFEPGGDLINDPETAGELWSAEKAAWVALPMEAQIASLPECMHPRAPPRGRFSYSIKHPDSEAVLEILLRERAVFARRSADGETPSGPRSFAWRACGSPLEAFKLAAGATSFAL
jgi:hypothetical protein